MLYGNSKLYDQTYAIKKGDAQLSPCMEAVRAQVSVILGIQIVSVVYDTIEIGPAKGRPRLNVIVNSDEDEKKLMDDPFTIKSQARASILNVFSEVVTRMELHNKFDTNNVLLLSDTFSDEVRNQAAFNLLRDHQQLLVRQVASARIWEIHCMSKVIVVFFEDEEAKRLAVTSGISEKIRCACYSIMKQDDEFNYITLENTTVVFDSKENLDKKYQGSLFYYFR